MPVTKWEIVITGEASPVIILPKIKTSAIKTVAICFEVEKKNTSLGYNQDDS